MIEQSNFFWPSMDMVSDSQNSGIEKDEGYPLFLINGGFSDQLFFGYFGAEIHYNEKTEKWDDYHRFTKLYEKILLDEEYFMKKNIKLFLDSGAYSAFTKKIEINIKDYIAFIKKHKKWIHTYSVLDSIGNAELTLKNQRIMEDAGLDPLPCYHYGEDYKYLELYLKEYPYIAIGGMVPIKNKNNVLMPWLDNLFTKYICDESGLPKVKVHGFGMTSLSLMLRYPWYSVDSTSWVMTGRFGSIFVPKKINGKYDYIESPHKICVSDKSENQKEAGRHFNTLKAMEREEILDYIRNKGYEFGKPALKGKPEIKGVSNDYRKRDEINIKYFIDLQKNFPAWPWKFKLDKPKSLGLI